MVQIKVLIVEDEAPVRQIRVYTSNGY